MTSMIGDRGSQDSAYISRMLSKMDTDSSGSISRSEFVDGRSSNVSEDQAGSLFDALDSSQSGSLSISGLISTFQQMSSSMQATLLQTQQVGGAQGGHGPDASQMFSNLDTDEDGTLSKDEFMAGKPDQVSESDAESLWSRIAGDESSVTEEQFTQAMQESGRPSGPPPGPPPSSSASSEDEEDSSDLFSRLDTDQDGTISKDEFLAGKPDNVSESDAESLWSSIAGDESSLTEDQFASAMQKAGPPPGPPPGQMAQGSGGSAGSSSGTNDLSQQLMAQFLEAVKTYQNNSAASYSSQASSSLSVFAA